MYVMGRRQARITPSGFNELVDVGTSIFADTSSKCSFQMIRAASVPDFSGFLDPITREIYFIIQSYRLSSL